MTDAAMNATNAINARDAEHEQQLHDDRDMDLAESIDGMIRHYAPLKSGREYYSFTVKDGTVTLLGNVKSRQAKRYFVDQVRKLPGVTSVDDTHLYTDEELMLKIGRIIPSGVATQVIFGTVALSGQLVDATTIESFVEKIRALSGVTRVGAQIAPMQANTQTNATKTDSMG